MEKLIYTPRYFGPNAFPIPEVRSGKIEDKYKIEFRYDYHHADGDETQDLFGRLYVPFGKRAALELSGVIFENYHMTEDLMKERYAFNPASTDGSCFGDLIINSMFQLLESEKWFDATLTAGFKTASGSKLIDARYTDAAAYWFDISMGRNILDSGDPENYVKLVGMGGFYCYMTNRPENRQNDAWLVGGGIKTRMNHVFVDVDLRGFCGYWEDGDNPLLLHSTLKYSIKQHSLFARYQYGLNDYIYQTYSGGYSFSF